MGVPVEFNTVLALRDRRMSGDVSRATDELLPETLAKGDEHAFTKRGQRIYRLDVEIPLVVTHGNHDISRPLAAVVILEATHVLRDGAYWTIGRYRITEVFSSDDPTIHFELAQRHLR